MTVRKTRKQTTKFYSPEDKVRIRSSFTSKDTATKTQIQHCVSQLKRFAPCIQTHPLRSYQFFYNLGRLQELLDETTFPKIWWNPIETLLQEGNYPNISKHADSLKNLIGVPYDDAVIVKGC
jgi:hypothetical protein